MPKTTRQAKGLTGAALFLAGALWAGGTSSASAELATRDEFGRLDDLSHRAEAMYADIGLINLNGGAQFAAEMTCMRDLETDATETYNAFRSLPLMIIVANGMQDAKDAKLAESMALFALSQEKKTISISQKDLSNLLRPCSGFPAFVTNANALVGLDGEVLDAFQSILTRAGAK